MSSVLDQKFLTIKEAAKKLPGRPHVSTIWRWIERGIRGHKLESWLVGGQRFTSIEALESFLAGINGKPCRVETAKQREKAIAQAERELNELGL